MPKGGHNKKPTALKVLEGTARRDRLLNEPLPACATPKCPEWLPREGKKKWRELAPKLEKLGLLTELDGEKLAAMCMHWALMVEATQDLKERGFLVTSAREGGELVKNPSLQVLRDNSAAFDRYAGEFGMGPRSRSYIDLPAQNEDDDFMLQLTRSMRGGDIDD
jgi:P27 family predicted phage terminase small subunit